MSRNVDGTLLVNQGTVSIRGGTPTVTNKSLIRLFGFADHDVLALDLNLGAVPGVMSATTGSRARPRRTTSTADEAMMCCADPAQSTD